MVKARIVEVEEKDQMRNWQPPITGEMIMQIFNITPSKQVGMIKDAIREAILDGIIPNEYEAAYTFMIKEAAKIGLQPAL
jgi:tRNA nucleotidyltransferase (CCA-adding enzyme)